MLRACPHFLLARACNSLSPSFSLSLSLFLSLSLSLSLTGEQGVPGSMITKVCPWVGAHTLFTGQRERKRERGERKKEREGEGEKEIEREIEREV